MKPIDPCHVPVNRGVEYWNTLTLQTQILALSSMIDADMARDGQHSGMPVCSREDHPLEPILVYLRETLAECGGAR